MATAKNLRPMTNRFTLLADNLPEVVIRYDRDFRRVYVNKAYEQITGNPAKDILGTILDNSWIPDISLAEYRSYLKTTMETGKSQQFTLHITDPHGNIRHMSVTAIPDYDDAGLICGTLVVSHDTTNLMAIQETLRSSEAKFRTLIEGANDGVTVQELPAPNEITTFTDVNEVLCQRLGYSREELLNMTPPDITHPDWRDALEETLPKLLADGSVVFESVQLTKDGRGIPVEVSARLLELEGKLIAFGLARDITDRKHIEQQNLANLRFFESMDKINSALQREDDLKHMLQAVLDVVIDIFDCDRTHLIYPCDPEADAWQSRMERTKAEYPSTFPIGVDIPMTPEIADMHRISLSKEFPVAYGEGTEFPLSRDIASTGVQTGVGMAIYPAGTSKAWGFSMVQCSHPRIWSEEELRLFNTIGHRIADGVSALLSKQELMASEQRLEQAQRMAHVGYWEADLENNRSLFSKESFQIMGISPQQHTTELDKWIPIWENLLHPDDRVRVLQAVTDAMQGIADYSMEYRLLHPDGNIHHVYSQAETIRDENGKVVRLIGMMQDITERKQVEQEMLRINRFLRTLSRCNETLVHAKDEQELLRQMCRIAVDRGEFTMACITYLKDDHTLKTMAHYGLVADGFLDANIPHNIDDKSDPNHPVLQALETGDPQVIPDTRLHNSTLWKDRALDFGFSSAIILPLRDGQQLIGTFNIYLNEVNGFGDQEVALLEELADDLSYGIHALRIHADRESFVHRLQTSMESTIQALSGTVEIRDPYTAGHQRRVAQLAVAVAERMGYSEEQIQAIYLAGVVHDIGKIAVPFEILSRPGRLSETEMRLARTHVEASYNILRSVDFPWPIADIVRQHHERLDGSGYPLGLKGDAILEEARILTVCDVVEAMTTHRPYRPGLGIDAAMNEIEQGKDTLYDAKIVDVCTQVLREGFQFD